MKKIYYPEKINFSDYQYEINNPKVFYGLNPQVKFCKKCSMVNQMPISTVEFNHTIEEKKIGMNINQDQICDPCILNEKKKISIGPKEKKNLLNYVINTEKQMDLMIVLFQALEVKIVFMHHMF